jgi:hypothetical protein
MSNEWQPIETAPKDGTHIIAWNKTHGEKMCCWYWHENTNDQLEEGWIYYYGCASYKFNPKKWKPMTIDNNQLKGFPPNNEI